MNINTYSTGSGSLAASASSFCSLACLRLQCTQTESEFEAQGRSPFSHQFACSFGICPYKMGQPFLNSALILSLYLCRNCDTLHIKWTCKTEGNRSALRGRGQSDRESESGLWFCGFTCCPSRSLRSACWPPGPSQPSTAKPALGCPPWSSSASPPEKRKRSAGRHTRPSASGSPSPGPAEDNAGETWRSTSRWHTGCSYFPFPEKGLRLKTWDQLPSPPPP